MKTKVDKILGQFNRMIKQLDSHIAVEVRQQKILKDKIETLRQEHDNSVMEADRANRIKQKIEGIIS